MNYQPSFSRGPSAMPVGAALGDLGWISSQEPEPLRAFAGEPPRDGAAGGRGTDGDEAQTRPPGAGDRERPAQDKGEAKREPPRRRVPDEDIIDVGPRPTRVALAEPIDVRELLVTSKGPFPAAVARDASVGRRHLLRPLLAFLVLEIVVSAGIYFGKRYAESQVIVVPTTSSGQSVIT